MKRVRKLFERRQRGPWPRTQQAAWRVVDGAMSPQSGKILFTVLYEWLRGT